MTDLEQVKKEIKKTLKKDKAYDWSGDFYMNSRQMEKRTATLKICRAVLSNNERYVYGNLTYEEAVSEVKKQVEYAKELFSDYTLVADGIDEFINPKDGSGYYTQVLRFVF